MTRLQHGNGSDDTHAHEGGKVVGSSSRDGRGAARSLRGLRSLRGTRGGTGSRGLESGLGGLSRAGSGGDERAALEGVVAEALSDLGSAVGLVGIRGGLALAVSLGALLGASSSGLLGLARVAGLGGLSRRQGSGGRRAVRASSGGDESTVVVEGVEAEARRVLSGAGGLVGARGDAALVVGGHALLGAVASGLGGNGVSLDGLADGAAAVRDGQGGGLSDGVGRVVESESGGLRAVSGQVSDNLGGVLGLSAAGSDRGVGTIEGVEVEALGVLRTAVSEVGIRSATALIVLLGALLSTLILRRAGGLRGVGGLDGLADSARAVGDGEGGGLGDGVGLVAVGEGRGSRAVGGELGHDLSGVDDTAGGVGPVHVVGLSSSEEGASKGETSVGNHLCG